MDDLVPLILQYASFLPKYRRVCKAWNKATDINIDLGYHIDSYFLSNYGNLYDSILYMGGSFIHMKKILDNDDWDVILRLISLYHNNRQKIGILCNFLYSNKKFDYCNKVYNFLMDKFQMDYCYEPIAPFMIYHMYKINHKDKVSYAKYFYDKIHPSIWIGYIHPDMVSDLSLDNKHIRSYLFISYYCELPNSVKLSYPDVNVDIQDTKDVIIYKYGIKYRQFTSFPIRIHNK